MVSARAPELLKDYRRKRDFAKTAEPSGEGAKARGGEAAPIFVVQKHDATRLHFDFRIELDGVLKSWAVTRGPSLDPADKRLAVRVEDHPLDYATFEGTIPKGQYGGGTVMLWDFGTWEPIEDVAKGLKKGSVKLRLHGQRMKGGWALVRMKPREGEKRENWLLIKENDEEADRERDLVAETMTSVETGRTMEEIAGGRAARKKKSVTGKGKPQGGTAIWQSRGKGEVHLPDFVAPQLATLVDAAPSGRDWRFELKYDGYRAIAAIAGETVRIYTRNGHDWTDKFAHLVPSLSRLTGGSALLDGEICAFNAEGKTDFSTLKDHLSTGKPLVYFVFDLLERDGESLRDRPLRERQDALAALISDRPREDAVQLSPVIRDKGEEVFAAVCKAGHEGIIAKRADAAYRSGRGTSWLKVKCILRQEFIIVGWRPSDTRKGVFASLLLATEEEGKLVYRGRVGTGFSDALREELQARLDALARKTPTVSDVPRPIARAVRWVAPQLVAEIAYTERTPDGVLRHPSFIGLREDKPAKGITLETPKPTGAVAAKGGKASRPQSAVGQKGRASGRRSGKAEADMLRDEDGVAAAEAAGIRVTSPDRVMFPEQGVTKARIMAYYAAIADTMLPFVANRPLSLVRCPGGRAKQCFFQKHNTGGFGDAMKSVDIVESSGETNDYFYLDDLAGLLAGVQMGVLEYHIWGSRRDNVEKPDRLIFDIDPDEGLDFALVKGAARDLRDRLEAIGLRSFPLVTGGKGVHVVVPVQRRAEWPEAKAFAAGFARMVAGEEPERFTATLSKAKRKGKMFIDYLRNERGSTAISPFSTRSRPGAPVAVPVDWDGLDALPAANVFSLDSAVERAKSPFWDGYWDVKQSLTAKIVGMVE